MNQARQKSLATLFSQAQLQESTTENIIDTNESTRTEVLNIKQVQSTTAKSLSDDTLVAASGSNDVVESVEAIKEDESMTAYRDVQNEEFELTDTRIATIGNVDSGKVSYQ